MKEGLVVVDPEGHKWHLHMRRGISERWGKVYPWAQVNLHTGPCVGDECHNGSCGYTQKTPVDRFIPGEGFKRAFERAVRPFNKATRSFLWRELWRRYKQPGQESLSQQIRKQPHLKEE